MLISKATYFLSGHSCTLYWLNGVRCRQFFIYKIRSLAQCNWKRFLAHRSTVDAGNEDISTIRNIGILAHIDAGKTTTTERMLFNAGFTRHLGDVDDGDTVMDYMNEERERGITITSAAISFYWKKHKINLIDTPGHVDFTVEVERALRVLDGAVTVLDASAGVEAQTLTVWRQASKYNIPLIVFLNKMDKAGANLQFCINSLKEKLHIEPLVISLPIGKEKTFSGVVDLVTMHKLVWNHKVLQDGRTFSFSPVDQSDDGPLYDQMLSARSHLIGQLSDLDEKMGEIVLSDVKIDAISAEDVSLALKRVTLQRKGVPIICGSSLKNRGVQPLLDAIVSYLPSPSDMMYEFSSFYGNNLCALAFKIIHHKHKGCLTFLRLYSGMLKSGSSIYNINRHVTEKSTKLLHVYADEFKEVPVATAGNIVCIAGLKDTVSGDTITNKHQTAEAAKKAYKKQQKVQTDTDAEENNDLVLAGLEVPPPVFFCSVEPPSPAYQKELDVALQNLQREDPSLRVEVNSDTGQTVLTGMGELHLEIIKSRLLHEYKINVEMGPLQIAYRETITKSGEHEEILDTILGVKHHNLSLSLSVQPCSDSQEFSKVTLVHSKENNLAMLKRHQLNAINSGIELALTNGPTLSFPVINIEVCLHDVGIKPGTSLAMISACASQCVHKLLKSCNPVLLEPVMKLEIMTDDQKQSTILADLSKRRSQVEFIDAREEIRVITAVTPLSELMGYSTTLRTITSGTASFSMELSHYQHMNEYDQSRAVQKVTGFAPVISSKFHSD